MVNRIDPARVEVIGGDEASKKRFIESDYRIRSGLCPNGCGLMTANREGQDCPQCGFSCNTFAELIAQ